MSRCPTRSPRSVSGFSRSITCTVPCAQRRRCWSIVGMSSGASPWARTSWW
ncbi:Uncharacterised protein [Mycobacteroides abscessus]|nr:Uncharacterised protein [Mycobacteroides abscessus]